MRSSTKYLTNTHQNCQGQQKQGKYEIMSKPIKALGDMRNKCNMISWMGSQLGKIKEI